MASEENQDQNPTQVDGLAEVQEKHISALLSEANLRELLIQKLTDDSPVYDYREEWCVASAEYVDPIRECFSYHNSGKETSGLVPS